jgi:hypothetical protein
MRQTQYTLLRKLGQLRSKVNVSHKGYGMKLQKQSSEKTKMSQQTQRRGSKIDRGRRPRSE